MATQTIELSAPTGLSLTLTTYPDGSNTGTVRTLVENTLKLTSYSITFTGTLDGLFFCLLRSTVPISSGWLQIANLDGTYTVVNDKPTVFADSLLLRNIAGNASGGRTVQDALRTSRNRVKYTASTFTVYKEDDTTVAWSGVATPAVAGDLGVTEIDPS